MQVESLRADLERVQMGLALMGLSVQKLVDIVSAPPGCCSLLDFLLPVSTGMCTVRVHLFDSITSYRTSSTHFLCTTCSTGGGHELHVGARTAKLKPGPVQPIRKLSISQVAGNKVTTSTVLNHHNSLSGGGSKLQEIFHHRQIKSKGYDNVATSASSSMMFSIEGTEDDDEDI